MLQVLRTQPATFVELSYVAKGKRKHQPAISYNSATRVAIIITQGLVMTFFFLTDIFFFCFFFHPKPDWAITVPIAPRRFKGMQLQGSFKFIKEKSEQERKELVTAEFSV